MCTVVILRRPGQSWPLILAGNRDEMENRPWLAPARHWPDTPDILAGRDELAGGSWLGLNDHGVVATILNRAGTLGPAEDKRSRGELVLDALDHADAADAADSLAHLNHQAYRPFNLLIADNRDGFWLRWDGRQFARQIIEEGLSMITAHDLNDRQDPRINRYLPKFAEIAVPDPDQGKFDAWENLLADRAPAGVVDREAGLTFRLESGFGTSSAALIALPSAEQAGTKPIFRLAAGPPDRFPFASLSL